MIKSVYWPEATDDHGNFSGNAMEFADFAIEVLKNFRTTMHYLTNISIDFPTDDQADVQCYFHAYHEQRVTEPSEAATVTVVGAATSIASSGAARNGGSCDGSSRWTGTSNARWSH